MWTGIRLDGTNLFTLFLSDNYGILSTCIAKEHSRLLFLIFRSGMLCACDGLWHGCGRWFR